MIPPLTEKVRLERGSPLGIPLPSAFSDPAAYGAALVSERFFPALSFGSCWPPGSRTAKKYVPSTARVVAEESDRLYSSQGISLWARRVFPASADSPH